MRKNRAIGVVAVFGALALSTSSGCDLVAGIGEYCTEGVDPGCGTGGTGGAPTTTTANTGGTGGTTTTDPTGGGGAMTTSSSGGGGTTTTNSSGGGGTGGGGECETEGATQSCYTGPAGTVDVGACKAGVETCQPDGMWGPCLGAILPGTETCASDLDEDCDGSECAAWVSSFGDNQNQNPRTLAVDTNGNILLGGLYDGTLQIGMNQATESNGLSSDIFLAKFDSAGTPQWAKFFANLELKSIVAATADGSNNVIMAGTFDGTLNLGDGNLVGKGQTDIFLAKYKPNGDVLWSKGFGNANAQYVTGMGVDALGDIFVTGYFFGSMDWGGGVVDNSAGLNDVFVAKLSGTDGTVLWKKTFGDNGNQLAGPLSVDESGDVVVAGRFGSSITFGSPALVDATSASFDVYVAKLTGASGAHVWSKSFGAQATATITDLKTDALARVVIAGDFTGDIDFGGGVLAGTSDVFVAKFESAGGHQWSKRFGGGGNEFRARVADDALGRTLIVFQSNGAVDLGGGAIFGMGMQDIFMGMFDDTGAHQWSRRFGDSQDQSESMVTFGVDGDIVFSCRYDGTLELGTGGITSMGMDIALAVLAP